jgi:hypothetical protein
MSDRLSMFTITRNCINRGNLIIEQATQRVLGLGPEVVAIDAHRPLDDASVEAINQTRSCLLPGATLVQPGDHPAVERLSDLRVPILALGVALSSRDQIADLRIARQIDSPIGSRDPFTHDALTQAGRRSWLVGCQTLLLGTQPRWQSRPGNVVVTLGLGAQSPQIDSVLALADRHAVTVLCHAPGHQREDFGRDNVQSVPLQGLDQALQLLGQASVVVTGRIHALLTCLVLGTPVIFMSPWFDSRYSLLQHLEVPVEPPVPARICRLVEAVLGGKLPSAAPLERAEELRGGMRAFLREVALEMGWRPTPSAMAS